MIRFLIILLVGILFTDFHAKGRLEMEQKLPLVIAHRGASGEAPENTLVAIRRALEVRSDVIEIDVHLSKDKEVMVIHDASVDRTTNGEGLVQNLTKKELQALDAGNWKNSEFANEQIPSLSEVLELINGNAILLIEIKKGKSGRYSGIEDKVWKLIKSHQAQNWVIVQSFETETVNQFLSITSEIEVHKLIVGRFPLLPIHNDGKWRFRNYWKYDQVQAINPYHKFLTKKMVRRIHRQNQKVFTYTVNEISDMNRCVRLGVDGIITNYPAQLKRLLQETNSIQ